MCCHLLFILPCFLWATKDTSQHNTAGAQYTLSNPPHIPLTVLLFSLKSFSSASPLHPSLLPVVFTSPLLVLLLLLILVFFPFPPTSSYL